MTLRECLDFYEPCGVRDEDIIFQYFLANNKEEVAIKMMADLSAAKLAEYKGKCDHTESALTCFPISYLIKQYGQMPDCRNFAMLGESAPIRVPLTASNAEVENDRGFFLSRCSKRVYSNQ